MTRVFLPIAATLGLAACLDFDGRYATQLERLDAGAPGLDGGGSGGASGSDAGPGDAGAADAGVADAGSVLPGCDASLCEYAYWSSDTVKQIDGLVASSLTDLVAVGDEYGTATSTRYHCDVVTPLSDGGLGLVPVETNANPCRHAAGRPGNFWTSNYSTAFHVVNGRPTPVSYDDCLGSSSGGWESAQALSDTEALFAGDGLTLCRIDDFGQKTLVSTSSLVTPYGSPPAPMGLYRAPSGQTYLACDDGTVRVPDGGQVSPQMDYDGTYYGLMDMAGTSDSNVWTVGYFGTAARLGGSGTFEPVFDAGVGLRAVAVVAPSDVWVAGRGPVIWHYNGQTWSRIPVPHLSTASTVYAIAAGPGYLHLGGIQQYGVAGFILSFQRGH